MTVTGSVFVKLPPNKPIAKAMIKQTATIIAKPVSAPLVRRELFEKVGFFDESLRRYEDWDWFLRIRERGVRLHVDDNVANEYRRRPGSTSQVARPGDPTMHDLLKRSLDRRRAGGDTAAPIGSRLTQPPKAEPSP